MTYWISIPGITFRLEAKDGYIVAATRLAANWVGQAAIVALDHYRRQGARMDWIKND